MVSITLEILYNVHFKLFRIKPFMLFNINLLIFGGVLQQIINCQRNLKPKHFRSTWQTPNECNKRQIYNSITFKCIECENAELIGSTDKNDCQCSTGSISTWNSESHRLVLQCFKCSELGLAVSTDNLHCAKCVGRNITKTGKCVECGYNEIISTEYLPMSNTTGFKSKLTIPFFAMEKCILCPIGTIPDAQKKICLKCDNALCFCNNNKVDFACGKLKETQEDEWHIFDERSSQKLKLDYISKHLDYSATLCSLNNRKQCQHLANLCVLQNYNRISLQSACSILDEIRTSLFNSQQIIPSLFYPESSIELFRENSIEGIFTFDYSNGNNKLNILAAVYALDGTFIGIFHADDTLLNICSKSTIGARKSFKFGRLFQQSCEIDVLKALIWNKGMISERFGLTSQDTIIYELYLRYLNEKNEYVLYPIPIVSGDIHGRSKRFVNNHDDFRNSYYTLVHRFFLIDKQFINNNTRLLMRVPTEIILHIQLQKTKNCRIYPPYLYIRHLNFFYESDFNYKNISKDLSNSFQTTFKIEYYMDNFQYDKTLEVIMGSFCSLSLLFGLVKAYSWGRRTGRLIIDASTIIKFALYTCENIANVFFCSITLVSIWILFTYKYQKNIILFPLNYDQEYSFFIYVIASAVLNGVVLVHNYITLALVETFFIDWEKPRIVNERSRETTMIEIQPLPNDPSLSLYQKGEKKHNPVVIWRTYLIANEWNELQNYRKTNIIIQLLGILFVLDYLQFGNWAIMQPGFERFDVSKEYAETRMSRFATDMLFYLTIGFAQWAIQVFLIEKIIDPFRNFMDLCSIANISVLTMTHSLYGHYIHGRSVHGLADTDMFEMNIFLQREKENLCGLRGLENGSEIQTFHVSLPRSFRERLDQLTLSLKTKSKNSNLRQHGIDRTTVKIENTAAVYTELNQFLKDIIDHTNPNCDYIISDAKLIEEIIGLELTDTGKIGNFIRDTSETGYCSAFLYGNEWIYLTFDALVFCLVDMITQSRIFSCFITYIISTVCRETAKIFFTNNLIKSSLIDNRFLV